MNKRPGPVVLTILDGWGIGKDEWDNSIKQAYTPFMDYLQEKYPFRTLECSGEAVGLPEGQMGNSEVGHLNIGAGRVVYQDFTRINKDIREKTFFQNPVLLEAMENAKQGGRALHFMGLVSDGGVHSHLNHLFALLEMAKQEGVPQAYVHAFLDGRDVPPTSARKYLLALEGKIEEIGYGQIASIAGRYYAMDRDKRWERIELALDALTCGKGRTAYTVQEALNHAYREGETDEFIIPTIITDNDGEPIRCIGQDDVVIFFNFRPDRARQITHKLKDRNFYTFTQYDETLDLPIVFPPEELKNTLGEVLSKAGLKQLRIAETEKYAHVTFFFNGGEEVAYPGEERILINSPKVPTYDLKPEMSAYEVTEKMVEEVGAAKHDVIILNYANADMVGHTGDLKAAIAAIEAVDKCLKKTVEAVQSQGGLVLITSDHGNAEKMVDHHTKEPYTAHTSNQVPFIVVDQGYQLTKESGSLADIAPTILYLVGVAQPKEMTGQSLLKKKED